MKPASEQGMSLGRATDRPYRLAPQGGPTTASALPRLTYTVAEVAEMLGRSPSFIRELIEAGHLRAFRFPDTRTWFVRCEDLHDLINGMEEV